MIFTKPHLSHDVSVVSRYMSDPSKYHWKALKWIFRYKQGVANVGVLLKKNGQFEGNPLKGYVDSEYTANVDTRKSQIDYISTFYSALVSYRSILQFVVALH